MNLKRITADDLRFLDEVLDPDYFEFDLVYSRSDHPLNRFGKIYRSDARMVGHIDMVTALKSVGNFCSKEFGWKLRLLDCMRTVEAQEKMMAVSGLPSTLLSRPGYGGHSREMAIDLQPTLLSSVVDLGCDFDSFSEIGIYRAHRSYLFQQESMEKRDSILANRYRLNCAFDFAFQQTGVYLEGLKSEWWDYRIPESNTSLFRPIYDASLPSNMRMTSGLCE